MKINFNSVKKNSIKYIGVFIIAVVGYWMFSWIISWSLYGIARLSNNNELMEWLATRNHFEPAETAYSAYLAFIRTTIIKSVEPEMVSVEGGTFTMGSSPKSLKKSFEKRKKEYDEQYHKREIKDTDDEVKHQVTVSSFQISKYEVTREQWKAVMDSNPSFFNDKDDNYPVENVSWNDVQEFLRKLNAATGKHYRLPTEAEWEYASRGGNRSNGYIYSGSNNIDSVAWYDNNSGSSTHPVGQKSPNELGIYDMSGNVWEWCSDWYGSYPISAQTNPTGPSSGSGRVLRGGSCYDAAESCRSAYRNDSVPGGRGNGSGFRVVAPL